MAVTKPYEFIGFGAMAVTKPCEFIGFGAMAATKPYEFYRVWGLERALVVEVDGDRCGDDPPSARGSAPALGGLGGSPSGVCSGGLA